MTDFSYRQRVILAIILCTVTTGMGIWNWLYKPHAFIVPREMASDFLKLVHKHEFEKAHALTLKNTYTGQSLEAFKEVAAQQICSDQLKQTSLHPLQTNANRLRRQFNDLEVEMPALHIEFIGPETCLFKITLHHIGNGNWKIFKFGSHAG